MATHKIIEIDDLMLEGDVHKLLDMQDEMLAHIKRTIPDELLFLPNGEPNVRTRWGAVHFHISMARGSVKAFM